MWKVVKKLFMGVLWLIGIFVALFTVACVGLVCYDKWLDYKYQHESSKSTEKVNTNLETS